jgi:CheY-like chemotaxis protein/HPt (histidine-containing phosphotransfer) domain-containing protein
MNGDIKVESQPGQGSMFTVHIPLNRTDDTNSLSEVGSVKFDLSRKSLLVVDDNETNRIIVEQMLEEHGVKVFHAENGEQALALLADDSINSVLDFIMMDISMPVMSGIEVVQIIRAQNLVDSNLPIIAMTAHVQPDEQQTFYDAGMDGFLGKPFQISELIQVLRVHDQEFNHECFLRLKSDTGKTGIDRLVASFRRDAEKRLATLKVSYATENWKEFSAQSHALGSSAGMFGTLRLYRICRRVEFAYQKDETAELKDLAVSLIGLVIPGVEKVESWHKAAYGRDQIL